MCVEEFYECWVAKADGFMMVRLRLGVGKLHFQLYLPVFVSTAQKQQLGPTSSVLWHFQHSSGTQSQAPPSEVGEPALQSASSKLPGSGKLPFLLCSLAPWWQFLPTVINFCVTPLLFKSSSTHVRVPSVWNIQCCFYFLDHTLKIQSHWRVLRSGIIRLAF